MTRNRKRAVISRSEALRRLRAMCGRVERDVRIALWAEAVLNSGNEIFPIGKPVEGGNAYMVIVQSLVANLAITLARLFDPGSRRYHPNRSELASLPLIIRLLRQRRCQKLLLDHARKWTPDLVGMEAVNASTCTEAIAGAIKAYRELLAAPGGQSRIRRLRHFRNFVLAHTMMDDPRKRAPLYSDLFILLDVAREIVDKLKLAIDGSHIDLPDLHQMYREIADRFWSSAFQTLTTKHH